MAKNDISSGVVHKVPTELKEAILADPKTLAAWENLTPLARNEWICWVTFVKREETKKNHIERLVKEVKGGKRRPCCWIGCIHRTDKEISPSIKGILSRNKR